MTNKNGWQMQFNGGKRPKDAAGGVEQSPNTDTVTSPSMQEASTTTRGETFSADGISNASRVGARRKDPSQVESQT